ncbi:hypothetical protein HYV81_01110 [Candidatus Woesearchaeota archaeon]|nr:hypothetical protein [Candidatus Woesearchaeota archaeon]
MDYGQTPKFRETIPIGPPDENEFIALARMYRDRKGTSPEDHNLRVADTYFQGYQALCGYKHIEIPADVKEEIMAVRARLSAIEEAVKAKRKGLAGLTQP